MPTGVNRLRLVGGVGLTGQDGQDVRAVLAQPKRLALLVYLAVGRPQGFHRRDTLLGLFWSESNEDTARAALSRALHHLRQALGAEAIVSRGDDEVAVDATRLTSDLSEFTEALERGDMSGALALYTSDFLAGFHVDGTPEFDRWVEGERDRIRILAFAAATGAVRAAERDGDLASAVALAARANELSPYSEPATLDLMRLLAAQGNRADALRAYDAFERRLRSDLDAAPGQALADAAEQIRKGSAPAAPAAPAHGSAVHDNAARKPDGRAQPAVRADQPPVAVEALHRPSPRLVAVSIAIAATIIAALVWGWRASVRDRDGVAVRFVISTPDEGASSNPPAISPDGRTVVFSARRGGTSVLYRRVLDDSTAYPIAGTEHARQPFFSPDGNWVGFMDSTGLKKVRLAGGAPVPIGPIGVTNGATWARGDVIVVCAQHELLAIPASGGAPRPIAPLDSAHGELAQEWPLALDDGETVLYASLIGVFDSTRIGVASLKKGTTRLLDLPPGSAVPLAVIDGRLVYATSTGALMAVPFNARAARVAGTPVPVGDGVLLDRVSGAARAAISPTGSLAYAVGTPLSHLVLVDVQGRERLLAPEAKAYGFPRYSPDGRYVAVTVVTPRSMDVWNIDVASGTSMKLTSEGFNDRPEWTADGKRILYRRRVETPVFRYELWWQPWDGSGSAVRLQDPGRLNGAQEGVVSPDGRTLAYRLQDAGRQELWYRPLVGDTTPRPMPQPRSLLYGPRFSPDGRWLAYASNRSGVNEVYVRPFPAEGASHVISSGAGDTPVWSRDGRRLYYVANGRIAVATITTAPEFAVASRAQFPDGPYDLAVPMHAAFDVAPDGQHLLMVKRMTTSAQLMVVHDWKYEMRARVGQAGRK